MQTPNVVEPAVESQTDQIEKFIERIIEDAKGRPLVANVALVMMSFGLLSSVSALPALWSAHETVTSLTEVSQSMSGFSESQAFASRMMIVSAISLALLALQTAAAHGLYKMRRYGIYAVAATALLSLGLVAVSGPAAIAGIAIPGVLFYFLWNDRKKFA